MVLNKKVANELLVGSNKDVIHLNERDYDTPSCFNFC